jgi:hypothetical protein
LDDQIYHSSGARPNRFRPWNTGSLKVWDTLKALPRALAGANLQMDNEELRNIAQEAAHLEVSVGMRKNVPGGSPSR